MLAWAPQTPVKVVAAKAAVTAMALDRRMKRLLERGRARRFGVTRPLLSYVEPNLGDRPGPVKLTPSRAP
ncbi:hypothetical protein Pen01_27510 [Phytomonospora endophytica]|nr:hypothetical protein Pen01_27510 [Phytomonospora endophytica]